MLHHINSVVDKEEIDLGIVNPGDIKFGSRKYYRYIGSLTVPPCTEGVVWTIVKKVLILFYQTFFFSASSLASFEAFSLLHRFTLLSRKLFVYEQVRTVSREQVRALRDAVHDVSDFYLAYGLSN